VVATGRGGRAGEANQGGRMKRLGVTMVVLVSLGAAGFAGASDWSLGTNLGFSVLMPRNGGDNLVVIGVPGTGGPLLPCFQPGLRVGSVSREGGGELYADLGLASFIFSGESITSFTGAMNVQRVFRSSGSSSPYVTGGAGFLLVSYERQRSTNFIFGGGLGVRRRVPHGHGALRTEMRLDYIPESDEGITSSLLFGIKFGFDLWMQ
jgi:hypothetical protein